jgi:hypothetical protein
MDGVTCATLGTYLTAAFPNCRDGVLQILEVYDYDAGRGIAAYGLLSEVFIWGIFHPAVKQRDAATIERCYEVVEELLASPDVNLHDAVAIRVIPYMSARPWREFTQQAAGARLASAVGDIQIDPNFDHEY